MDTSRSRPFGVTLVAIFFLAIAALSLLIAARYVLNPASNEDMILLFTRLKIPVIFLNLLAVPPLLSAGLATLLFRGLWEGQTWSRVAAVIFSFIAMLMGLTLIAFFQVFNIGARAIWMAVGAFVLSSLFFLYFLKIPWQEPPKPAPGPVKHPSEGMHQPVEAPASPPLALDSVPPVFPFRPHDPLHSAPTIMAGAEQTQDAPTIKIASKQTLPLACLTILVGENAGKQFEVFSDDILIGRHPTAADVVISDPTVSARHARLQFDNGRFIFTDLDSTNGSFVNQQKTQVQVLHDQDRIKLGAVELLFSTSCSN